MTVVGTSKGAEFASLLAANGFAVDNLVAFVPAHYSYSGLDFSTGKDLPSFSLRGEAVPFASFRQSGVLTGLKMLGRMITAYPVSYRPTYEGGGQLRRGCRPDRAWQLRRQRRVLRRRRRPDVAVRRRGAWGPVSYTHLTLPTICSV